MPPIRHIAHVINLCVVSDTRSRRVVVYTAPASLAVRKRFALLIFSTKFSQKMNRILSAALTGDNNKNNNRTTRRTRNKNQQQQQQQKAKAKVKRRSTRPAYQSNNSCDHTETHTETPTQQTVRVLPFLLHKPRRTTQKFPQPFYYYVQSFSSAHAKKEAKKSDKC